MKRKKHENKKNQKKTNQDNGRIRIKSHKNELKYKRGKLYPMYRISQNLKKAPKTLKPHSATQKNLPI